VVQLYAGAFFPGMVLAALYVGYIIVIAKWKPALMPPLAENERRVPLTAFAQTLSPRGSNALAGTWQALTGSGFGVSKPAALGQFIVTLVPAIVIVAILGITYRVATAPVVEAAATGLVEVGGLAESAAEEREASPGVIGAPENEEEGVKQPGEEEEPEQLSAAPAAEEEKAAEAPAAQSEAGEARPTAAAGAERFPAPTWFWIVLVIGASAIGVLYRLWNWERLEVFKLLLTSFFPLALLILAVLGSIVFGLATPAEAAAVGAFGGFVLVLIYRFIGYWREAAPGTRPGTITWNTLKEFGAIIKESSFLTARTSAMVCWLFVGSGIFSAAFALLGGQELVEKWVLSLDLTTVQFLILAQVIIFLLGWPLEWTEIIIIFMPIFIPLLPHFNVDPLFFGILVALNLQTAFLSPPVAMAAFYLKGVSPPHVSLNAIFAGMMPYMGWQIVSMFILYTWPQLGLWLPSVLYGR
jgi:TRAP-type mannitol/chloroaromatic compound transport system permease large subunit